MNTGHATHKDMAGTTDGIAFLRKREAFPDIYKIPLPSGMRYTPSVLPPVSYTPRVMKRYCQLFFDLACPYPDLMTVQMIAELSGYSTKTVPTWTAAGHLRWFRNGMKYYAPKELVIEHLMSEDFRIPILRGLGSLGKWADLHLAFMKEHQTHAYVEMLFADKRVPYLREFNEQAAKRFQRMVTEMQQTEGVTEQLKAKDQLSWVQRMNEIASRAKETVLKEMVYR